jgi:tRNA pseudouridine13 synthase
MMAESEDVESPRKKVKLSNQLDGPGDSTPATTPASPIDAQIQKELEVGITSFVSPRAHAFSGILKKRYTDFLVNEILPNGEVLHLRSTRPPTQQVDSSDDTGALAAKSGSDHSRTDPANGNSRNVLKQSAAPKSSNQVASEVEASKKTSDEVRC